MLLALQAEERRELAARRPRRRAGGRGDHHQVHHRGAAGAAGAARAASRARSRYERGWGGVGALPAGMRGGARSDDALPVADRIAPRHDRDRVPLERGLWTDPRRRRRCRISCDFLLGGQYLILKMIGALCLAAVVQLLVERRWRLRDWLLPALGGGDVRGDRRAGQVLRLPLAAAARRRWGCWRDRGCCSPLTRLGRAFSPKERTALTVCLVGAVVAVPGAGVLRRSSSAPSSYAVGTLSAQDYAARFVTPDGYFSLRRGRGRRRLRQAHTSPDDRLFVWGLEPLVYFLSDRRPASRFMHAIPLLTPWSPPEWREQADRGPRAQPAEADPGGAQRRAAVDHGVDGRLLHARSAPTRSSCEVLRQGVPGGGTDGGLRRVGTEVTDDGDAERGLSQSKDGEERQSA